MTFTEFLNKCTACGGNWTAMLLTGIKACFPEYYATMPDKPYDFYEVCEIVKQLGVDTSK